MGMSITYNDNSAEVKKFMERAKEKTLVRIGEAGEGFAQDMCPEGTPESTGISGYVGGTAKQSITHAVDGNAAIIGSNLFYIPYLELGTSRMKARPFLKPAATEHDIEYKAIIEQEYKQG